MPSDKARVMLTLDDETNDFLKEIAELSDVPVAAIITKMLNSHLHELAEYHEWMRKQKDPRKIMFGKNLLQSYGPDTLIDGIRRLDPKHRFLSDQFKEMFKEQKAVRDQFDEMFKQQKSVRDQLRESLKKR